VKTLFIEPGSPWENGYVESFNGRLAGRRDYAMLAFTYQTRARVEETGSVRTCDPDLD